MSGFVCLFVCLEFCVPLENFLLIWRRHHCRWRAANFDQCSALPAIEQWGFFSVPHLLHVTRPGHPVYNGHLQWPVTLTPNAERWIGSGAVTTCFNDLGLSRLGFEHPTFRLRGELLRLVRDPQNTLVPYKATKSGGPSYEAIKTEASCHGRCTCSAKKGISAQRQR